MKFTYEKRLGKRNVDRIPVKKGPEIGKVFDWFTQEGMVACFPDHWDEDGPNGQKMEGLEPIPEEIQDIRYIGKLDIEEE